MRPGLSTLRTAVVIALVASPGLALARRAAWGKRATAESTEAVIDQKIARTGSALRSQFGAAVANAVDEANDLGSRRREGGMVDFEASKDRQAISNVHDLGGVIVTRSRQVARSQNGQAIHGIARQASADGSSVTLKKRSVITDGRRNPRTVAIESNTSHEGPNGTFETSSQQVFTRSRWGGANLESDASVTTRSGAFAAEGLRVEQDSTAVWGRGKVKQTERRTIADNGQERRLKTTETRKLGGLLTVRRSEGFATNRAGKLKQVGASRQVMFGGKTLNLGRQRADRAPPTRWTPRDATASRGRLGGRGR